LEVDILAFGRCEFILIFGEFGNVTQMGKHLRPLVISLIVLERDQKFKQLNLCYSSQLVLLIWIRKKQRNKITSRKCMIMNSSNGIKVLIKDPLISKAEFTRCSYIW
jgi:hypothetical protein